jgi:uncharacterized protein
MTYRHCINILFFLLITCAGCEGTSSAGITLKECFQDSSIRELADAASSGNIQKVDRLINSGIDVNSVGTYGITPLWWAMSRHNFEGFNHLLDKGANPNVQIGGGHRNVMDLAAITGDSRYLEAAIRAGGNVNLVYQPDKSVRYITPFDGETPLFSAIIPGNKHNIELLISKGANLNFQNPNGVTPMMKAANINAFDIVYDLLIKGADPTLKDNTGNTIVWSIKNNRISPESEGYKWREKVVELLKEKGMTVE